MNTTKFLIAGLAVATLSTAPNALARDTEEQIKAREALQQKMNELNAAKPAAATPAPAPAKPAPTPAPTPKPAPVTPVAQPAPAPKPAPAPVAAPVAKAAPAPTTAPAPVKPVVQAEAAAPVPAAKVDPAAESAREAALRSAVDKASGFSEVPPPSNTGNVTGSNLQVAPSRSAVASTSAKSPRPGQYQPLVAPASPLDAAKESQLAELLRRYRADEITPEQYHTERAKIIGAK